MFVMIPLINEHQISNLQPISNAPEDIALVMSFFLVNLQDRLLNCYIYNFLSFYKFLYKSLLICDMYLHKSMGCCGT